MKTEITISEPVQIRKARSVKEIATKFHSQPIAISEEVKLEPKELVSSFGINFWNNFLAKSFSGINFSA